MQVRLQIAVLEAPAYNPRMPADIIICGYAKMQFWFSLAFTMLFVSPCESRDFPDPRDWLELQGLKKIQAPFPFLSKVPLDLLVTICVFASRHIIQARSEVSQRPSLQLLKPEQDFLLLNFPNTAPRPFAVQPAQ